jgi:hypothetical protein
MSRKREPERVIRRKEGQRASELYKATSPESGREIDMNPMERDVTLGTMPRGITFGKVLPERRTDR